MIFLFILCTFANVVISTIKSVMTIKGSKTSAAIWNAVAFGLYTYIVVLTATASISTIWKVIITAGCNLIGVYGVKLVEEKMRKDKIWKVEMTISNQDAEGMHNSLTWAAIPNYYFIAGKHAVFSCFCESKEQTDAALAIGKSYHAKTFASETTLSP